VYVNSVMCMCIGVCVCVYRGMCMCIGVLYLGHTTAHIGCDSSVLPHLLEQLSIYMCVCVCVYVW
jgi:hypothetical protein